MTELLEHIIASRNQDIPRLIKFFENCFSEKTLEKTQKFDKTKN
jgi:hypothetical protein